MEKIINAPQIKNRKLDLKKRWYVEYSVKIESEGAPAEIRRVRKNIPHLPTVEDRMRAGIQIVETIKKKLREGADPLNIKRINTEKATIAIKALVNIYSYNKRETTITMARSVMSGFLKWLIREHGSNIKIGEITGKIAQNYIDYVITNRGVAPVTINNMVLNIARIFNLAIDRSMIEENPFRKIKKLKITAKRTATFDDEQLAQLFDFARKNNPPLHIYVILIYYCGLRPSEITNLKKSSFEKDFSTIITESTWTKNKRNDVISIPEIVRPILMEYVNSVPEDYYIVSYRLRPNIRKGNASNFYHSYKKDLLNTGIKQPPYHLRHTAISKLINSNQFELIEVSRHFRHSSTQMTMRYYEQSFRPSSRIAKNFPSPQDEPPTSDDSPPPSV
jgi:integrase/recombinase XerD